MSQKIVRVPITGFVKIAVDAPNTKQAESTAYSIATAMLSPRNGVTDLNFLLDSEDFSLTTESSSESTCLDEDYIDF